MRKVMLQGDGVDELKTDGRPKPAAQEAAHAAKRPSGDGHDGSREG